MAKTALESVGEKDLQLFREKTAELFRETNHLMEKTDEDVGRALRWGDERLDQFFTTVDG